MISSCLPSFGFDSKSSEVIDSCNQSAKANQYLPFRALHCVSYGTVKCIGLDRAAAVVFPFKYIQVETSNLNETGVTSDGWLAATKIAEKLCISLTPQVLT